MSFAPLRLPKWRSPCNQNSLNILWMLGTDFCAWVLTKDMCWGFGEPHLAGETWQLQIAFAMGYVQFSSVAQSCPTVCNPTECSMPGFSVLHQLLDLAQTHITESVMPSNHLILYRPLLLLPSIFPIIRTFLMSKFFTSVGQSIGASASASVFPVNIQGWFPLELSIQGTLKSLLQHHNSKT